METNEKLKNFLSATALVIDDEIVDENSTISRIISKLEQQGTLFVKHRELLESIDSISNIAFIVLDWDLMKKEQIADMPEGVSLGATLLEDQKSKIRDFIKDVIGKYFIPIFIFTQENIESIKEYLECEAIVKEAIGKNRVYLSSKGALQDDQVIVSLNDWLNNSMTVYTYKIMEEAIETAKHKFFNEMYTCDVNWPCHVYQILKKDEPADINSDFQEFLMTSFTSTINPIVFNPSGFERTVSLDPAEVIKIFGKIKFLSYEGQANIGLHSGDIYVNCDGEKNEYLINVSASCDMRYKRCYFVMGKDTSSPKKYDIVCTYTVKRILEKKGIEFHLDNALLLDITDANKITLECEEGTKDYKRIGRLLNPYISGLQNKYSNYITRVGELREP